MGCLQGKVVASMPKQRDSEDPEVRQLPTEGLSCNDIRHRLNYKVPHNVPWAGITACKAWHSMAQHGTAWHSMAKIVLLHGLRQCSNDSLKQRALSHMRCGCAAVSHLLHYVPFLPTCYIAPTGKQHMFGATQQWFVWHMVHLIC